MKADVSNINGVCFERFLRLTQLLSVVTDIFGLIKCHQLPAVVVNKCLKPRRLRSSSPRLFVPPACPPHAENLEGSPRRGSRTPRDSQPKHLL